MERYCQTCCSCGGWRKDGACHRLVELSLGPLLVRRWEIRNPKSFGKSKSQKKWRSKKKLNSFHGYKFLVDWYPSCLMMSFENVVWWQIHFIQVLFFLNRGEPGSAAESLSRIPTKTSPCRSQHILVVSRLGCPEITRNWIKIWISKKTHQNFQ